MAERNKRKRSRSTVSSETGELNLGKISRKEAEKSIQESCEKIDEHEKSKKFQKIENGEKNSDENNVVQLNESDLTCAICADVYHDPISLIPCVHSFCSGCISIWITRREPNSLNCPMCRTLIDAVCKNQLLQLDSDTYLSQNPSKIRTDGDVLYLDAVNIFEKDIVILPRANEGNTFNIYADSRGQAMEYAAVLVPLGVRPSSIFYHYLDNYGNSFRRSL